MNRRNFIKNTIGFIALLSTGVSIKDDPASNAEIDKYSGRSISRANYTLISNTEIDEHSPITKKLLKKMKGQHENNYRKPKSNF